MLTASNLAALKGVKHAFFTRQGGVSDEKDMSGLNCGFGSDDSPENVARNRDIALARMGAPEAALVTAYQVHSAKVVRVEDPWPRAQSPEVDAMASRKPGIALGILTADCAPVLFVDAEAGVVGAAHAGWRGAISGVLESCLAEMTALGAEKTRIAVAVGPCIGQKSYEVGPEFHEEFINQDPENEAFFIPSSKPGHHLFDLASYVGKRLQAQGLASVEVLGVDTCAEPELFYSYRRCTLNGEKDYGRLLSAIMLED